MPDSADDFETRLATVERETTRLRDQAARASSDAAAAQADAAAARADAGVARMLAAGADHDVSEVRAELRSHTQALNALRETQVEQGQEIAGLRTEMREGFARVDREMRQGFATMATGMAQITALLTNLDK
ncbi:MAG: hypothetical protein ACRDTF_24425 [Pseudonocardiaceae bacterium]